MRALLICAWVVFVAAGASGQTVAEFFIAKTYDAYQTGDGTTATGAIHNQINTNPYGLMARITGTGLSGSATNRFTPPTGPVRNFSTLVGDSLVYPLNSSRANIRRSTARLITVTTRWTLPQAADCRTSPGFH